MIFFATSLIWCLVSITVEIDLERTGGDEVRLDRVRQEESHQSGVELVLESPREKVGRGHVQVGERILAEQNETYHDHLECAEKLSRVDFEEGWREVLAHDFQVGISLADDLRILLERVPVATRIARTKFDKF